MAILSEGIAGYMEDTIIQSTRLFSRDAFSDDRLGIGLWTGVLVEFQI